MTPGFLCVPPLLAVEVAGRDEDPPALRRKADGYLSHGTGCVWIVLPERRSAVVVGPDGEREAAGHEALFVAELPGLAVRVAALFGQLH